MENGLKPNGQSIGYYWLLFVVVFATLKYKNCDCLYLIEFVHRSNDISLVIDWGDSFKYK